MTDNRISKINEQYFGDIREKRYLMEVYRDCLEKLITCGLINELYILRLKDHDHSGQGLCQSCSNLRVIRDSSFDALVLNLRLLFSPNHKRLASDFLKATSRLNDQDFVDYFKVAYDYDVSVDEISNLTGIAEASSEASERINTLYVDKLNPYQSNIFHQSSSGRHYQIEHTEGEFLGMKSNIYKRSVKFERNLKNFRDMLGQFAKIVHNYMRFTTSSKFLREIYIDQYILEGIGLFNLNIQDSDSERIRDQIKDDLEEHLHVLVCGDGSSKHNYLSSLRIEKYYKERDTKEANAN